jgi:hypothetical protein
MTGDVVSWFGRERTPRFGAPASALDMAWSPDGRRVATAVCWEGCAVDVYAVPPGATGHIGDLGDGVRLQYEQHLGSPTWTGNGTITAIGRCCHEDSANPPRALAFDATTGRSTGPVTALDVLAAHGVLELERSEAGYAVVLRDGRLLRLDDRKTVEVTTGVGAFTIVPASGS